MSILSQAVGEREGQAPVFATCLRTGASRQARVGEIRGALVELNRRSARLLMVEPGEGQAGPGLAGAVRDRERRLTAVIEAAGRVLQRREPVSEDVAADLDRGARAVDAGAPDLAAGEGDLAELQTELLALTESVDAFLADPGSDSSFAGLDQRLGEVESRLGCPPVERASRPEPVRGGLGGGRHAASNPLPVDPRETTLAEPPVAAWSEPSRPSPMGWAPPIGGPGDAGAAADLAVLRQRVRRLEGQLRLSFLLLLLTAGLAAFGLWRQHGSEAGWPVGPAGLEQRRSPPPTTEPMLDAGQVSPIALADNGAQPGAAPDTLARAPGDTATEAAGEASVETPSADGSADGPSAIRATPGLRDSRPGDPASPEGIVAVSAPRDEPASAAGVARDAPGPVPPPPEAEGEVPGGSDALVLEVPSYAIQLVAFRDKERMLGYVAERGLADRARYGLSSAGGRLWYALVLGFYPTHADAQAAADELPEALKRLDPWIRQFPAGSRFERFDQGVAQGRTDGSASRP